MYEKSQTELRADICEVGRRVWQRGYVAYNDGNLSIRLDANTVLATPTGVSKGFLKPDMLVLVDLEGNQIGGHLRMSSEIQMHLTLYRERCDIGAVVHSHPPHATAFAVIGEELNRPTLPEAVVALSGVPLADYGAPGTPELSKTVMPYIHDYDVFMLSNHGVTSIGRDIFEAYYRTETLEHLAHITYLARCLGGEREIPAEELPHLRAMRSKLGLDLPRECLTFPPGSSTPLAAGQSMDEATVEALVAKVAERLMRELRTS